MTDRPTGTVTFLFTDVEGSTRLWEEHPEQMQVALERHDGILRRTIEGLEGYVFSRAGDAFAAAFARADQAVAASVAAQQALESERWPEPARLRVRMGLHSGEAQERDGDYFGAALNQAARLMSAANGGQVVLSSVTEELVRKRLPADCELRDLGEHRLKDLSRPQRVFALRGGGLALVERPLRTIDGLPGNLPGLLPAFIGRGRELAALLEVVGSERLITVTGPPGTGKTRLAIQAAAEVVPNFPGGVWFADLSQEDGTDVLGVVARALSIAPEQGGSADEAVIDLLRYRPTLLLIDNCERAVEEVAAVADRLLEACAQVVILATSREPLRARVERVFVLGPMELEVREEEDSEAVALFVERAQSEGVSAQQLAEDRAAIEELCARLDGLPLAIELAAARARAISPRQVLERLDERFRMLKSRHAADARHETLRSAIAWSHESLEEEQRGLFERLSVFQGPFELGDAVALASETESDELDVLDSLASLVDHSMVVAQPTTPARYQLLETLRAYGADRLGEREDVEAVRRQHAEHFALKATEARGAIVSSRHVEAVDGLVDQVAEYRAACLWARARGDLDLAVRLATCFCGASYFRIGYDALDWLGSDPAAAAEKGRPLAGELLGLLARRAVFSGAMEEGVILAERSIALEPGRESFQARGQMALVALAKRDPAMLDWAQGAADVALGEEGEGGDDLGVLLGYLMLGPMLAGFGRIDEGLEIGQRLMDLGDLRESDHARGWAHQVLGRVLAGRDAAASQVHLQEAARLGRSEKNRYLEANARLASMEAQLAAESTSEAAEGARTSLRELQASEDNGYFTRRALRLLVAFLGERDRAEAARLWGYLGAFNDSSAGLGVKEVRESLERLRERLGDDAMEAELVRGSTLRADEAIELAAAALLELGEEAVSG